jgi:outer membrane protein TolC
MVMPAESPTDSLSLKTIIADIIKNHPTIKSAEEALNNADARIGLARTGYYPMVDVNANYSFQIWELSAFFLKTVILQP